MDQKTMDEARRILEAEPPMLFLGAGFSVGASNEHGEIPLGDGLKREIIGQFIEGRAEEEEKKEVEQYELQDVCQYVDDSLKNYTQLRDFLVERLQNGKPADFHYKVSRYPWKKIYTVNIDDLVENVYRKNKVKLLVQNQPSQKKKETDQDLEYIKLHGCVNGPREELVFSRKEYSNLISGRMNFKLNDLVHDIQYENFLFIGASLDEADIDSYVTKYEQAGYFRKGKMIFVDPKPTIRFRNRVKAFSGILLEWTTEQFMAFLETVRYDPDEQEKCVKRLNYSGIHLYQDIIGSMEQKDVYESRLYEGYNCEWRDVLENWLFESPYFEELKGRIGRIDYAEGNTYCIALYGKRLVGKGCLLKQIGAWLYGNGCTVLEFKGKSLDRRRLFEFMQLDKGNHYALLIEDASFNYKVIEKMYRENNTGKKLLVITTSRNYYHLKKRYYLEGNPYEDYEVKDKLNYKYAQIIYRKLTEKGYLGSLSRQEPQGCAEITKYKILSNLFVQITYGKYFEKRVQDSLNDLLEDYSEQSLRLFKELTLFDQIDLPYYPSEMLTARYSIDFNCFHEAGTGKMSPSEEVIVDFVRVDAEGVTLKNQVMLDQVWKHTTLEEKREMVLEVLKYIAPYFSENDNNYWRMIFESFLKEDILENKLHFKLEDILSLFYQLKEEYGEISYYWLQMGIVEQRRKDYAKALNHLQMAKGIRPKSYQIQHAIARNYLKQANYTEELAEAEALFKIGEKKMFELINSHEYYKNKAKSFSIHCYVLEEIRYLKKHGRKISNDDIRKMKRLIDSILDIRDDYINGLLHEFISLLRSRDRLEVIRFQPGDKYWNVLKQQNGLAVEADEEDMEDILTESY